jgi:predicted TIM-barrel fold metal-dependent hydrolase
MRQNRFPVIDADGHVIEPSQALVGHLGEGFAADNLSGSGTYTLFPSLDGWFRASNLTSPGRRDTPDPAIWLSFLDECGIAQTVLYPTAGLAAGLIQDATWAVTLCRAYNSWLHATYSRTSPRFVGVALLPVQDVAAAVTELRRASEELGFPAAMLCANTVLNKGYGHADFWPLYAEAERLGVALAVHGAPSRGLGFDYLNTFIETHTLEHPVAVMIQLTNMMFQGVFEEFPGLRVAYLECGAGWVPYLMDRFDEEYERRGKKWAPRLRKRPSEYLCGGQVYVSIESEERTLPYVLDLFGEDHVFFASDYPHERSRHEYLSDIPDLEARADLTDANKRKILADNARRFYRLE